MRDDFSAWWAVGSTVTLPFVRVLFRVRVEGIDHVPASGPGILAFNHVSVLDGPALAIETAFRRRREVRFLVAAEVFDHWFYGRILRSFDQIPIHRGEGDADALDTAIETVRAGALAAIAPEGRVSERSGGRAPADPQRLRPHRAADRRAGDPRGDVGHAAALAVERTGLDEAVAPPAARDRVRPARPPAARGRPRVVRAAARRARSRSRSAERRAMA